MSEFIQQGPELENQYESDPVLRDFLKRKMPPELLSAIENDLSRFGKRVVDECLPLARAAEASPPFIVSHTPWGKRVDEIKTSEAWKKLNDIAAEERLISIGYQRKQGEFSRIYQFAKLYLYHPSSAIYTCPLAMTDGAARLIEVMEEKSLIEGAFARLTSDDPGSFWTSGQWMTEKTGGSDVRRTQTVARKNADHWELSGVKWFSSATTSQMAMTLAREENDEGPISLFYLETYNDDGSLNNIEVLRLKDKLGTKALPTAELKLKGAKAQRLGESGKGIKNISHLFNVTRIYNALCAVANMRRMLALSTDYAKKREAFGKKLICHGLHRQTLFEAQTEYLGCFLLVFRAVELMGINETGKGSEDSEKLLRLLTPLAKLYTGKKGVAVVSELLESFGGAGYVEDTGIPVVLRDAQVLSIWEGTTNILSLDTLRSIMKEEALSSLFSEMERLEDKRKSKEVGDEKLAAAKEELSRIAREEIKNPEALQTKARDFAFALANVYCAFLLREAVEECVSKELAPVYRKAFAHWLGKTEPPLMKARELYQVEESDLL